jgi:hypothetical protein
MASAFLCDPLGRIAARHWLTIAQRYTFNLRIATTFFARPLRHEARR